MEREKLEELIVDFIKGIMKDACDECRTDIASSIAYQAAVWGSYNTFEGVGILECAKLDYIRVSEQVLREKVENLEITISSNKIKFTVSIGVRDYRGDKKHSLIEIIDTADKCGIQLNKMEEIG